MCAGCRRVARCHATPRRAPRRDRPGVGGLRGAAGSPGEPCAAGPRLSAVPRLVPGSAPHRTELGGSAQKGFGVTVTRSNPGKSALPPQALPDQRNVSVNVLICGAAVPQLADQAETCFGDGMERSVSAHRFLRTGGGLRPSARRARKRGASHAEAMLGSQKRGTVKKNSPFPVFTQKIIAPSGIRVRAGERAGDLKDPGDCSGTRTSHRTGSGGRLSVRRIETKKEKEPRRLHSAVRPCAPASLSSAPPLTPPSAPRCAQTSGCLH